MNQRLFRRFLLALGAVALLSCSSGSGSGPPVGGDAPSDADGATLSDAFLPEPDVPVVDAGGSGGEDVSAEIVALPACASDDDCARYEHCLPSYSGKECLPECLVQESCPTGYFCKATSTGTDDLLFVCLPDLPQLCLPCADDAQCNDGICATIDGQGRCATFCAVGDDPSACPDGYVCEDAGGAFPDSPDLGLCRPRSGSCECSERTDGQKRPCFHEGAEGTCKGFEVCDPAQGWVGCDAPTPTEEDCDGVDNDCDGAIDEALPESVDCEKTTEGVGTCAGQAVCAGQFGWLCDAPVPSAEACDAVDNDCDGATDEDFRTDGVYDSEDHCGACNVSCDGAILHGTAHCDATSGEAACAVLLCDVGYHAVGRFQCLENAIEPCRPCSSDVQCGGGVCLDIDGSDFCTAPCEADGDCTGGFECVERIDAAGTAQGRFCLPVNGTCDCTDANAAAEKACAITNDFGTCFGTESCDPAAGWVGCTAATPEEEVCDGLDNDCDGAPDDGLPVDAQCQVEIEGVGTCPGISLCLGARGWVCDAPAPDAERCDQWDNDCDGETDEDFLVDGAYLLDEHCGRCNAPCTDQIPNATAACEMGADGTPRCVIHECAPGFYQVSPTQCLRISTILCAPCLADADCHGGRCATGPEGQRFCARACEGGGGCPEGYTCDDSDAGAEPLCVPASGDCLCTPAEAGLTRPCFVSSAFGTCYGYETCDPAGGWTACTAATPVEEDCNGGDDDCDGAVDEGFGAPEACEVANEYGTCAGSRVCVGGAWSCTAGTPAEEVCNYQDDDCDGDVDGPFRDGGLYAFDGDCGGCGHSCEGAVPNGTAACSVLGGVATCTVTDCEDGFVQLNAFSCVERPAVLCLPCASDDDCLGGVCHGEGGDAFCTIDCATDGCPAGYACSDVAGGARLCLPDSGACDCDETKDGTRRWCQTANELGACDGFSTCDAATGWGPCGAPAPAEETCNGRDDDCDGRIDEDFDAVTPCETENELGVCGGSARCLGAAGIVCNAATPAAESCDGRDDDCDGETDEDFLTDGRYLATEHCGSCANDCTGAIRNATARCGVGPAGSPVCMVAECDEGYLAINDFSCILPPNLACRPCDADADCYGAACTNLGGQLFCLARCAGNEDCPGGTFCRDVPGEEGGRCLPASGTCSCTADNDGAVRVCSFAGDAGTCYGLETCTAGAGWTPCDARVPAAEACNGVDDDCDGGVDEELPDTQPCTTDNAYGSCAGAALCVGSLGWVCDAPAPAAEICDGVDNDCDGATDEAGALGCVTRYADMDDDGHGGDADAACLCEDDAVHTLTVGGDCDDTTPEISPSAVEVCNDIDDDCDGETDEEGAGNCVPHYRDGDLDGYAVPGPSRCLCAPEGEFTAAALGDCNDANGDVSPGTPERCNGEDEDCDGLIDEAGASDCTNYYRDGDDDGYGQDDDVHCLCAPAAPYTMLTGGDCNDALGAVHPGVPEVCNSFDDDCDGQTDEDAGDCRVFFRDEDDDGFGVTGDSQCLCLPAPPYRAVAGGDCDDSADAVSPVAAERCNDVDDDCDGVTDGALDLPDCTPYFHDGDGDSYGRDGDSVCACAPPPDHGALVGGDCDDASGDVHPDAPDPCNGVDDDCDGETDEGGGDFDGDGVADCVDACPIVVDGAAGDGGDGSVAAPFATLQEGLDHAGACAEVWVLAGTYAEHVVFGGRNVTLRAVAGPDETVIDGGGGSGSVVSFADGEGPAAGLVGFTVTGGRGTTGAAPWGDPARTYGGGVFVRGASPTIRDCVVTGNQVTGMGGGVFFEGSAGRFLGGAITDNTSSSDGDAGAGVALRGSQAWVHEATIRGNSTPGFGGGVLLLSSGGSVRYDLIVQNTAAEGAGLRVSEYGAAVVDSNVIADNDGEGVSFFHYTSTRFIGNTVVGNDGYGLRLTLCCGSIFAVPLIKNDIIAFNHDDGIHTDYSVDFGLFFTDVYSNAGGNYGGVMGSLRNPSLGITDNNCRFRAFSDNGDPDDDDLRLQGSSPCIDSGGDVTLYFVTRDFDGSPRPVVGAGTGNAQYDRGAFEYQP